MHNVIGFTRILVLALKKSLLFCKIVTNPSSYSKYASASGDTVISPFQFGFSKPQIVGIFEISQSEIGVCPYSMHVSWIVNPEHPLSKIFQLKFENVGTS